MEKKRIFVPSGYRSDLTVNETQRAIESLKEVLLCELRKKLNLTRITSPLFFRRETGLQDNLSGKERPVAFDIPAADGCTAEVVQSHAKWKRKALADQGFKMGEGIITDMNAIRRDEPELDNIHSVYVDQWDWEKIIAPNQRNTEYLKSVVTDIVDCMAITCEKMYTKVNFNDQISFVTAQELENHYPKLAPQEREDAFVRDGHHITFISQIGGKLAGGIPHGDRAPDYDDWSLNGDLIVWNDVLGRAVELSSMGIRVDANTLIKQLADKNALDRIGLDYHKSVLSGKLPQTIGGGIGQSRFAMHVLGKAHIGEVQSSVWDKETIKVCGDAGIQLL